ncbi:hypothetical protein [Sporosarcina sp. NPDC096371]|uniref:hypothetical protein n=1 Tax=Sporosarcina sp. NPDC096371 TaxID=3364530 RepID=UPI0038227CEF
MLTTFQKRIHEWLLSNFQGNDFSALSYNTVTNWFNPNPLSKHEIQQLQQAKIQANAKLHNFV